MFLVLCMFVIPDMYNFQFSQVLLSCRSKCSQCKVIVSVTSTMQHAGKVVQVQCGFLNTLGQNSQYTSEETAEQGYIQYISSIYVEHNKLTLKARESSAGEIMSFETFPFSLWFFF